MFSSCVGATSEISSAKGLTSMFAARVLKMSYFTHTVVQCTHQVYGVNLKKQCLKRVHVACNNSFRILHHLPSCCSASFMFVSNHIKSFNELIRSSIFSLLRRLQDSENPLYVNYFYTDIHFRSPMFKYWTTQLYI